MNYKQVSVCIDGKENSIDNVVIITDVETMEEAASLTQHEIQCSIRGDSEEVEEIERYIKEYYSGSITLLPYTAVVPSGETHIILVLSEDSPWYKQVDVDQSIWTYEKVQEWNKFIKNVL